MITSRIVGLGRVLTLSAFAVLAIPLPALAQDAVDAAVGPPAIDLSGSVAVVSDYRFRGVSLSAGDPALQGGIKASHASGFYAGAWASNLDAGAAYGDVELDLYAGWSGPLREGLNADIGVLYYAYPDGAPGGNVDYWEPYAALSTTLGPVEARLGAAWAPKQDELGGRSNLYLSTDLAAGIPATPLTLKAHLGYTDGPLAPAFLAGTADRTGLDWSLGATSVLHGIEFGLAYVGTEGPAVNGLTDDTIVGSIGFSF